MLINNDSQKAQFRTEFSVFLTRNGYTLRSFVDKFNKEINFITMLNRATNYGLINQRLNSCKKIDTEFFQKLIDLVDKDQRIQFLGQKVVKGFEMKKSAQEIYDKLRGCCDECKLPNEEDVLDAMEEYADQFKPKWISIEGGDLPVPFENILAICDSRICWCYTDFLDGKDCISVNGNFPILFSDAKFTHWMPLPEIPEK